MSRPVSIPELFALDTLLEPDEKEIRATVRRFGEERLRPHIAEWFESGRIPARDLAKGLGSLSVLGMHLEGYDCAGMSATAYGLACLELEDIDRAMRGHIQQHGSVPSTASDGEIVD